MECDGGEKPVRFLQMSRDLGLCVSKLIQSLENSFSTGTFMCSPTWSSVWENHPTSITLLYTTETLLIATEFTDALSLITAISESNEISSSVDSTELYWLS